MIKTDDRKQSFCVMVFWCVVWLLLLQYVTGCANWQGAEFRIGFGSYNGASETKTYTKEVEKK